MATKRKAALGFIFVTLLIDVTGFGIIIPVMPSLIRELTGGSLSDASMYGGALMFSFSIMQFLFSPVLGGLSDKYGRRPILLISLFGFGIDYLFLAYAPTIGWLFLGRVIAGIMGASLTTATAYIADISTPEKRSQNFGLVGAAFGLGFIIGPAIGGALGQFGNRIPFLVAAGLTFLNWLYGYFILPESLPPENRRAFNWKRANPAGSLVQLRNYPLAMGLIISLMFVYIAGHATQSIWTYYNMERFQWNEAEVGFSLAMVGILVAGVQGGLIRILNPKLGQKNSVYLGLVFYSIGFVMFAFAGAGWVMLVSLIPYCLGGIAGPSLQGLISSQVPSNEQGELQGIITSMISLTAILSPPLMTSLFSYFTGESAPVYFPGMPFLLGALLTLISAYLAMRSIRKHAGSP